MFLGKVPWNCIGLVKVRSRDATVGMGTGGIRLCQLDCLVCVSKSLEL
jgi:hypothetical protein